MQGGFYGPQRAEWAGLFGLSCPLSLPPEVCRLAWGWKSWVYLQHERLLKFLMKFTVTHYLFQGSEASLPW